MLLKIFFKGKATKFEKNVTCFDIYSVTSKQVGDYFKSFWPFQKTWTLEIQKIQIGIRIH